MKSTSFVVLGIIVVLLAIMVSGCGKPSGKTDGISVAAKGSEPPPPVAPSPLPTVDASYPLTSTIRIGFTDSHPREVWWLPDGLLAPGGTVSAGVKAELRAKAIEQVKLLKKYKDLDPESAEAIAAVGMVDFGMQSWKDGEPLNVVWADQPIAVNPKGKVRFAIIFGSPSTFGEYAGGTFYYDTIGYLHICAFPMVEGIAVPVLLHEVWHAYRSQVLGKSAEDPERLAEEVIAHALSARLTDKLTHGAYAKQAKLISGRGQNWQDAIHAISGEDLRQVEAAYAPAKLDRVSAATLYTALVQMTGEAAIAKLPKEQQAAEHEKLMLAIYAAAESADRM